MKPYAKLKKRSFVLFKKHVKKLKGVFDDDELLTNRAAIKTEGKKQIVEGLKLHDERYDDYD